MGRFNIVAMVQSNVGMVWYDLLCVIAFKFKVSHKDLNLRP